jgi:serine/threonine protein kinase
MPPRPDILEEPDFSEASLTLSSLWHRASGFHSWTATEIAHALLGDKLQPGQQHFLFSDHDISDPADEWRPESILGQGGFGTAGLWKRRDAQQVVVDEMVIKQEEELLHYKECAYNVTSEASIQRDAQRQMQALQQDPHPTGNHPILHLRNYEFNLPADKPRYYLLYAPNGTLEDLLRCYRVWNQYLPELFVWHVVHELSKAMLALSQPIHKTSLARTNPEFMENSWILHLDVKPANIFLGYPLASNEELRTIYNFFSYGSISAKTDPISTYPRIKLADFGVADIENEDGPRPDRGGTTTYMPTEQIKFGRHFSIEHQPINPADPWTSATNIFGVGRIIYDFLLRPSESLNQLLGVGPEADKQDYEEKSYIHNGNHFLSRNLDELIGKLTRRS